MVYGRRRSETLLLSVGARGGALCPERRRPLRRDPLRGDRSRRHPRPLAGHALAPFAAAARLVVVDGRLHTVGRSRRVHHGHQPARRGAVDVAGRHRLRRRLDAAPRRRRLDEQWPPPGPRSGRVDRRGRSPDRRSARDVAARDHADARLAGDADPRPVPGCVLRGDRRCAPRPRRSSVAVAGEADRRARAGCWRRQRW